MYCIVPNYLYLCVVNVRKAKKRFKTLTNSKIQKTLKTSIMKTQTNSFYTFIGKAQLSNYATDIKETVAMDFCNKTQKIFSAADMWNIERRRRTRTQRRFI